MKRSVLPPITEAQFLDQVIQLARLRGWRCAHFRPARTAKGWRTPVSADGKGFLDLVMVRERILWVETKAERGKLTPEQQVWMDTLSQAGAEVYLWRPKDWDEIERILE